MELIQREHTYLMKLMDAPNSKCLHSKCLNHLDEILRLNGVDR